MADIVIRGLEMPKSGYVEMLLKVMDGEVYYNYAGNTEIKAADYIPLPEGHGRLIDVDALKENLRTVDFWNDSERVVSEQDINNAPTIIPAEGGNADATREELFAAVRLLKKHCENRAKNFCTGCALFDWCIDRINNKSLCTPRWWADPEGGGDPDA